MFTKSLLKAEEVAEKLSLAKSTVYKLIQSGSIQSVRIGRSVRIRPEDLEEYIEKQLVR